MAAESLFHGLTKPLHVSAAYVVARIVHRPGQNIEAHAHDWACLTLPILGNCMESYESGEAMLGGPSVALHPRGAHHGNCIGSRGLDTVSVQFDPRWLGAFEFSQEFDRSRYWIGGPKGAAGNRLARRLLDGRPIDETDLRQLIRTFLYSAPREIDRRRPKWLERAQALITDGCLSTRELAGALDLHPVWLNQAYRAFVGEGIQDSIGRRRVEKAVSLLRYSRLPLASVAVEAGFCDQSHMNRCFRRLLRQTPAQMRLEVTAPNVC